MVAAEHVGFIFEPDFLNQYRSFKALAVMDNIETFHHKKMVAAEPGGFIFEADQFKSAPMLLVSGCHGQH